MSRNYDNWERLVHATLDREILRELARSPSIDTSSSSFRTSISTLSTSSSSFDFIDFPCPLDSRVVTPSISNLSNSFDNLELPHEPASEIRAAAAPARSRTLKPPSIFSRFYYSKKKRSTAEEPVAANISSHRDTGGNEAVEFQLSQSTHVVIQKGNITAWSVNGSTDAIVYCTDEWFLGYGIVAAKLCRAAGPELLEACHKFPEVEPGGIRCPMGEARITPGYGLPVSHVIHTVGPKYFHDRSPETSLRNAYRSSLCLARENNIEYIGFVALCTGANRYPYEEAATVAISTVKEFAGDFKEIHFILFLDTIFHVWSKKCYQLLP